MSEEVLHDNLLFDRLVDGELSDDERRLFLSSIDERTDGWRRCALAFLEAQTWAGDLGQIVREPTPAKITSVSSSPNRSPLRQGMAWLAIAASVLAAFMFGQMQNKRDRPAVGAIASEEVAPKAREQVAAANRETAPIDDSITLWVQDDAGRARPLRVPLVDAGALDRELGLEFQSAIPAGFRERLEERGYDVQSRRRYAPLWLENGRPMIVPVEDTKIVPVGQHVY